jgi:EAL domain-containing protein (putative c-di-GMP-specific phosphodiesterase class I)
MLKLEITESGLMSHADAVIPVVRALCELGVKLSIDDFGTGYSSLSYLHRLPVSELKIDRSFVTQADGAPEAAALLRTIIELGHSLQLKVVAEGVERPEEHRLLERLGCDELQGYLIAKPMLLVDFERRLAAT